MNREQIQPVDQEQTSRFINRFLESKMGKTVALAAATAAVAAACSESPEPHETPATSTATAVETVTGEPLVLTTTSETLFESLPTSTDPDIWAQQVYGVFNVVYNENRPDLFKYSFGANYYDSLFDSQIELVEGVALRKNDPSELDDYTFAVEVIDNRTDFDGNTGVISVQETRAFKWATNISVIDLTVGLYEVDVTLPSGENTTQTLLLIDGWDHISNELDTVTGD